MFYTPPVNHYGHEHLKAKIPMPGDLPDITVKVVPASPKVKVSDLTEVIQCIIKAVTAPEYEEDLNLFARHFFLEVGGREDDEESSREAGERIHDVAYYALTPRQRDLLYYFEVFPI